MPKLLIVAVVTVLGAFLLAGGLTLLSFNNIYVAGLAAETGIPVLIAGVLLLISRKTRPAAVVAFGVTSLFAGFIYFLPLSDTVQNRTLLQLQKDYCESLVPVLMEYRQRYGEFPGDLESEFFDRMETPIFFVQENVQYLTDGHQFSFLVKRAHSNLRSEVYYSERKKWVIAEQHPQHLLERGVIYPVRSRVRCYTTDAGGQQISSWCP